MEVPLSCLHLPQAERLERCWGAMETWCWFLSSTLSALEVMGFLVYLLTHLSQAASAPGKLA